MNRSIYLAIATLAVTASAPSLAEQVGQELSVKNRLADGQEYTLSMKKLIDIGREFFAANWTIQEGAGRPLTTGTGDPLHDPTRSLTFPNNFNRVSGPDAQSCAGCHNMPSVGGGGDIVANVFVLGQRFDFATFDQGDPVMLRGTVDETGNATTLQSIANSRGTIGMAGSGYTELLAREMTADLQAQRDGLAAGSSVALMSKGVSFGTLKRNADGTYDTSMVTGLPLMSKSGVNLIVRPFHQASAVISLRQFTNNAMNHHHGIQTAERFGNGVDADGDGVVNEMDRAEVTAATIFQATMPPPVQRLSSNKTLRDAAVAGEALFSSVGCSGCHRPTLPLKSSVFSEPNPYNPAGNLRVSDVSEPLKVDLNSSEMPGRRLSADPATGITQVPIYTDMRIHKIYDSGSGDCEKLNQSNGPLHSESCYFLTKRLWGAATEPGYGHHGKFTTLREAVEAHTAEATSVMNQYWALQPKQRDQIIEFLKSL